MPRGGQRVGAGRPTGSGKFGEKTIAIRVPVSRVDDIQSLVHNEQTLPLYQSSVAAGFPSQADSEIEERLNLHQLLVKHPSATFFVRVAGSSMVNAGIHHDDILVVDRSLEPINGKIVVAAINGELTVKRLEKDGPHIRLIAENPEYSPIDVFEEHDMRIWGVVTNVIHHL